VERKVLSIWKVIGSREESDMTATSEQSDARGAVEIAREQRRQIAEAVRLPGWYWALTGIALFVVFIAPAVVADRTLLVMVTSACIAVLGLVDVVVTGASGLRVRLHDARRYPSLRWPLAGLLGSIALGSAATWVALQQFSAVASCICGSLAALAILGFRAKALGAVRHDIADGWS
jgi:hypothetical protein